MYYSRCADQKFAACQHGGLRGLERGEEGRLATRQRKSESICNPGMPVPGERCQQGSPCAPWRGQRWHCPFRAGQESLPAPCRCCRCQPESRPRTGQGPPAAGSPEEGGGKKERKKNRKQKVNEKRKRGKEKERDDALIFSCFFPYDFFWFSLGLRGDEGLRARWRRRVRAAPSCLGWNWQMGSSWQGFQGLIPALPSREALCRVKR
jgi:hypothetical protein